MRKTRNLLLRQLPPADWQRLGNTMEDVALSFKQTLHAEGKTVDHVYFIERGVVSVVTDLEDGGTVETATVGHEGLVGLPAVLGGARAPARAFCQIPGAALRIPASVIHAEREQNTRWFSLLLRYANFVTAMMSVNAACNRLHTVEARASRWLLFTHDRVDSDEFPLTQEFLAQMLGVARPTVNVAGAALQNAGFIKYSRGRIRVVDRQGLESASCGCYQRLQRELERALGVRVVNTNAHRMRRAAGG